MNNTYQTQQNLKKTSRGDFQQLYRNRSVDDLIIAFMEKHQIPGLCVAIVQAPYIPRVVGYGLADVEMQRLVGSNTMFNVGKITNAYTAVAIMQLKEANQLLLEDKLVKYLPQIPNAWQEVTLYDLFTHSSGIACYTKAKGFDFSHAYTSEAILDLVKEAPLQFTPETNVSDSATEYYLLGLVIEKITGMSYEAFVTQNQFERIGLKNTCFISTLDDIKNEVNNGTKPFKHSQFLHDPHYINPTELAVGYTVEENTCKQVAMNHGSATFSDSGVMSSAEDISLWDIALAGDILVKDPANRAFIYNPVILRNGAIVPGNAHWRFLGHRGMMEITGNVPGYSTLLTRYTDPNELLCVTLVANKDHIEDLSILSRQIAGAYDSQLALPEKVSANMTVQSPYSVEVTLDRFEKCLNQNGVHIFARIDHSAAAEKVGLKLNPTQVLIFGNPTVGTHLMLAENAVALELPLKALAWKDDQNQVWLSVSDVVELAQNYGFAEDLSALIKTMTAKLHHVLNRVVEPTIIS